MRLGALYNFSKQVFLTVEAEKDVDFNPTIRGGIEYRPTPNFYLRVGAAAIPSLMAFGFGIVNKNYGLTFRHPFIHNLVFRLPLAYNTELINKILN